ncbi:hypothetical protein KBX37_25200 [Micromonospora sp. U56]|uniref:hypothetical protein n=1 Tax=Micromonospora sp. U56 TaxID=2824900 RepID=UPI001B38D8E8|nr:hypothetical protein [Micromonospora sp. U56]MBQ0896348.1 hypothetical protein [Micromonospora sp. U56]
MRAAMITRKMTAVHLAVLFGVPLVGCTADEDRGAYDLGADICTSQIVTLAGVPAGDPRRTREEDDEGRATQSCTFSVRVGGKLGRDQPMTVTATRYGSSKEAAEDYRTWRDGGESDASGVQDLGGLPAAAVAYRMVGDHQVTSHDDNLLVRVSSPDHETGNPPDLVTRLRKVAAAVLTALRRPDAPSPQAPSDADPSPDPVLTPSSTGAGHGAVKDLCEILDLSAVSTAKPVEVRPSTPKPGRLRGMMCSAVFPGEGGRSSQLLVSASFPVGGDGPVQVARMYAYERHRMRAARDVTGLGTATFIDTRTPTMPKVLAYDQNLRVEVMWMGTGAEDPDDLQRRLVAVADSVIAGL